MRKVACSASLIVCAWLTTLIAAQGVGAAAQPTASTGEAAQLTVSSATLAGSVYPGGQPAGYYFEYGTTPGYETRTPLTSVEGALHTIHLSAPIVGLSPGTTYHFRLVLVSASRTIDGSDRSFTTRKIPLTFEILATPRPDPFGSPFFVTGTLSGTESANHPIVLQANPFPYLGGFKNFGASQLTRPDGSFSFEVARLSENTQLRVATLDRQPVDSRALAELVAVRVGLHLRSSGRRGVVRVYGTVMPAQSGAAVEFQLLRRGRRPLNVGSAPVRRHGPLVSSFGRLLRIRRGGLYRAHVQVVSGMQVSNSSRPVLIR